MSSVGPASGSNAVFTPLTIKSHKGPYTVKALSKPFENLAELPLPRCHFLIDANVAKLYPNELKLALGSRSCLLIEATEQAKTLDRFTGYVEHLAGHGVRRGDTLVAIGGGIIQDTVCFLAATLLRGVDWKFYPTTLLAQADSCIGSKSSINVGQFKNLLGTFTPPSEIFLSTDVLKTLAPREILSGVGEILKVHIIDGPESFALLANDYDSVLKDKGVLIRYLQRSLSIKKGFIEADEFDLGVRNVLNYGHSFGHAIESATEFAIPHGIAVSMGMDMANFVACQLGKTTLNEFARMHPTLHKNYRDYRSTPVPFEKFLGAIARDKKNTAADLKLVLPVDSAKGAAQIEIVLVANDERFQRACRQYFEKARLA